MQNSLDLGFSQKDTFLTIKDLAEGVYKEKGSKFLAFAYPVSHEDQLKEKLQSLRKSHFDARHHCYAYILGANQDRYRANDDGEPNGTAGLPILGQIRSKNLTDVLVVVVRYFGGVKLGASGLVNAYKVATQFALEEAQIIEKIVKAELRVQFEYIQMNEVMKVIKDFELEICSQNFDNDCQMQILVRKNHLEVVSEKLKDFLV